MKAVVLGLAICLAGCGASSDDIVRAPIVNGWPQLPPGLALGQVTAVDVDGAGRVYVLQRGGRGWVEPFPKTPIAEPTVYVFDGASGRMLDRWGAGAFIMPHGLSVDPQGKVWITDPGREQVYRYSADGKRELALGTEGVTGEDAAHFGRPADVAFDGERVLIADGYVNGRVTVFQRDGRFLRQFGSKGAGAGQFAIPHAIASEGGRLAIADRENARLQWFDPRGVFQSLLAMPGGGHPYAVKPLPGGGRVTLEGRDGADRGTAVLRFWDRTGTLVRSLDAGAQGGPTKGHDVAVGPDGAIYLADVDAGRVVKIAPGALGR